MQSTTYYDYEPLYDPHSPEYVPLSESYASLNPKTRFPPRSVPSEETSLSQEEREGGNRKKELNEGRRKGGGALTSPPLDLEFVPRQYTVASNQAPPPSQSYLRAGPPPPSRYEDRSGAREPLDFRVHPAAQQIRRNGRAQEASLSSPSAAPPHHRMSETRKQPPPPSHDRNGPKADKSPSSSTAFASFSLHPSLLRGIDGMGFVTPTPIQVQAIPAAMKGDDVLACAPTGFSSHSLSRSPPPPPSVSPLTLPLIKISPSRTLLLLSPHLMS